jgi:hypothetical protein
MANRALAGAKSYTVTRGAGNRARAGKLGPVLAALVLSLGFMALGFLVAAGPAMAKAVAPPAGGDNSGAQVIDPSVCTWTATSTTPSTTGAGAAPWRPSLGDPATRAASRVRPNRLAGCPNPGCPCFL